MLSTDVSSGKVTSRLSTLWQSPCYYVYSFAMTSIKSDLMCDLTCLGDIFLPSHDIVWLGGIG